MRVVYNHMLPFGRYRAINLFGVVFAKTRCDDEMLNHEAIHTAQMRELLFVGFYLLYVTEWLCRWAVMRDSHKAYLAISFEREAYGHGSDLMYLRNRRPFSWLKHLK